VGLTCLRYFAISRRVRPQSRAAVSKVPRTRNCQAYRAEEESCTECGVFSLLLLYNHSSMLQNVPYRAFVSRQGTCLLLKNHVSAAPK
jgi:hypothetical protein